MLLSGAAASHEMRRNPACCQIQENFPCLIATGKAGHSDVTTPGCSLRRFCSEWGKRQPKVCLERNFLCVLREVVLCQGQRLWVYFRRSVRGSVKSLLTFLTRESQVSPQKHAGCFVITGHTDRLESQPLHLSGGGGPGGQGGRPGSSGVARDVLSQPLSFSSHEAEAGATGDAAPGKSRAGVAQSFPCPTCQVRP